MPFKRKFVKRTRNVAKVAKATKKYVKRVMDNNKEDKYLDLIQTIALNTVATDTTGSVVLLSGMAQGDTFATRTGEQIMSKKLEIRYDIAPNGALVAPTYFRIIIFRDSQIRTSTLPAVADVLEAVQYNSSINHVAVNVSRFHILFDKLHKLDTYASGGAGTSTIGSYQQIKREFKLRGKINYTNSSTGTQKGNIYVLYLSNQIQASAPSCNMYSRLIFEDA